jgi:hypothetical protein
MVLSRKKNACSSSEYGGASTLDMEHRVRSDDRPFTQGKKTLCTRQGGVSTVRSILNTRELIRLPKDIRFSGQNADFPNIRVHGQILPMYPNV